jgi:hypothetical protein
MNADTFIKARLADFSIREAAHSGGIDNMVGVAHVLRNRVNAGWHGGDWMRVLETAAALRGTEPPELPSLNLRDTTIKMFLQRVDGIYDDSEEDSTNGALYYADLHNITIPSFIAQIARNPQSHPRVYSAGLTTFFG